MAGVIHLVLPVVGSVFKRGQRIDLEADCSFHPNDPVSAGGWQAKEKNAPGTAWFDFGPNTLIEAVSDNPFPMSAQDTNVQGVSRAGDIPGEFDIRLVAFSEDRQTIVETSNLVRITISQLKVEEIPGDFGPESAPIVDDGLPNEGDSVERDEL